MRILITAGPTREYLDDVRYLSNASSGRMGYALAEAALRAGHQVELISGPVAIAPPAGCEFHGVETSQEMLETCVRLFPGCDGGIGAAAVCDYRPARRVIGKMAKTGQPLHLELTETTDVLAELGKIKEHRWLVAFALEADDGRRKALAKRHRKNCDAVVLNAPSAIGSDSNSVELFDARDESVAQLTGSKTDIARELIAWIGKQFGKR
jgi:phosphopantothenoylcysteine decarboxylase/phosphopantothenate--cysteine ligase